ncbi:ABC transporter permease [Lusitaniella coriacea]|uniref:ABC transporter permease n=1 Tax=Lusitaniella coriacea TaxID=1983105 RepID=UPI003CEC4CE9
MNSLITLNPLDMALALALIGIAIALSRFSNLGLEGQFAIGSLRALLQLTIAGYILGFVFALNNPFAVLLTLGVMLTVATLVTRNRIGKKLKRLLPVVLGSLLASTTLTLSYIIVLIIQPETWYDPQYLIPLAGMILGNAMDTATLAGERLVSTINSTALEIETHLSLGATPQQAVAQPCRDAVRASLIPTLNRMSIVGLVSLPGMLTGQVLGGIDPLDAALYQILIFFAIAFANLVAVLLVTRGVSQQFFNQNMQLLPLQR